MWQKVLFLKVPGYHFRLKSSKLLQLAENDRRKRVVNGLWQLPWTDNSNVIMSKRNLTKGRASKRRARHWLHYNTYILAFSYNIFGPCNCHLRFYVYGNYSTRFWILCTIFELICACQLQYKILQFVPFIEIDTCMQATVHNPASCAPWWNEYVYTGYSTQFRVLVNFIHTETCAHVNVQIMFVKSGCTNDLDELFSSSVPLLSIPDYIGLKRPTYVLLLDWKDFLLG